MTRKFIEALAAALKQQAPIYKGQFIIDDVAYNQWRDDVNAVASTIQASYARVLFLELIQETTRGNKVAQ